MHSARSPAAHAMANPAVKEEGQPIDD